MEICLEKKKPPEQKYSVIFFESSGRESSCKPSVIGSIFCMISIGVFNFIFLGSFDLFFFIETYSLKFRTVVKFRPVSYIKLLMFSFYFGSHCRSTYQELAALIVSVLLSDFRRKCGLFMLGVVFSDNFQLFVSQTSDF